MKQTITFLVLAVLLASCNDADKKTTKDDAAMEDNPFLVESTLPYYAPDFSKIKNEHYRPALLQGIEEKKENIEAIANSEEEPTFENTIVAMEKSGDLLTRTQRVFYAMSSDRK